MARKHHYQLSGSQLEWILGAQRRFDDSNGLRRFLKDERHPKLFERYEPLLYACLKHKVKRGRGRWREPSDDACVVASRIIIREVTRFVDHDRARIADGTEVKRDFRRLSEALDVALDQISGFTKRSVVWANEHFERESEGTWQRIESPKINNAFAIWTTQLSEMADQARHLHTSFPDAEHQANPRTRALYRRVCLTWFDTTGCWPVSSKNAVWPGEMEVYRHSADGERETRAPYVLMLLRLMTHDLDAEKAALLHRDTFVDNLSALEEGAARRASRPRWKLRRKRTG